MGPRLRIHGFGGMSTHYVGCYAVRNPLAEVPAQVTNTSNAACQDGSENCGDDNEALSASGHSPNGEVSDGGRHPTPGCANGQRPPPFAPPKSMRAFKDGALDFMYHLLI